MPLPRRLFRPSTPLGRIRSIACAVASSMVLAQLVPMLGSDAAGHWTAVSAAATLLLVTILVLTCARDRPVPLEPVVVPALIIIAAVGLGDPTRTAMMTTAVLATQALHGSNRAWLTRTVLALTTVPAGVALTTAAGAGTLAWGSGEVLAMAPFVMPGGLVMRMLHRILTQLELVTARDGLLSTVGARILAAADLDDVRRIATELSQRMIDLTPGTVLMIVMPEPDGPRLARSIGTPAQLSGRRVPETFRTDPAGAFGELAPGMRHWHVEQTADRYLVIGGGRPIGTDVVVALRNLVHQVVLGETSLRSRAELQYRAHHDYLTQLANRDLFFHTLVEAVERGAPGSVALLTVDLDDFKEVNDTYGHAAGDELLVEIARRLRTAAEPYGMAARFGGDEFAVLLTGLRDDGAAERIAADLCDRIAAPVRLTVGTVRVGASIGIAGTDSALTATELVRRADLAMYEAKAAGQNRVRRYGFSASRVPAGPPAPGS